MLATYVCHTVNTNYLVYLLLKQTQLSLPRYDTSTYLQYIISLSLLKEKEKSLGTKATMIGDGGRGSGRSGGGGVKKSGCIITPTLKSAERVRRVQFSGTYHTTLYTL